MTYESFSARHNSTIKIAIPVDNSDITVYLRCTNIDDPNHPNAKRQETASGGDVAWNLGDWQ